MDFDDIFADIAAPAKPPAKPQQEPLEDMFADFGLDVASGPAKPAAAAASSHTQPAATAAAAAVSVAPVADDLDVPVEEKKKKSPGKKKSKKKDDKPNCLVEGCSNKDFKRGYCAMHLNTEHDNRGEKSISATKPKVQKNFDAWQVTRSVQQGAYFKKNVIMWKFVYGGEQHVVMLKHSPVGGKRVIFVDSQKVFSEKLAGSSRHPLNIGNTSASKVDCAVLVNLTVTGVEYELEIKGGTFSDAHHIWYNSDEF